MSEFADERQGLRLWLVNQFNAEWLLLEWWQFVLDDSRCPDKTHGNDELIPWRLYRYAPDWLLGISGYLFRCQCRARNHPYGVGWYNIGALEPDITCTGCGENLG